MQKLTLNWLKRHIEFHNNDILHLITAIDKILNDKSIEIEEIKLINPLIVAKVTDVERKEGLKVAICKTHISDKLLNLLDYKTNEIQVLCGAENVQVGMKTILAPLNTTINGFQIKHRQIKGNDSFGMFCAYEEIGEDSIHPGIINSQLLENTIYRLDDVFIKVSTPTNRWDLMSVRGIARELAFAGLGILKPLNIVDHNNITFDINVKNNTDISVSFMKVNNIKIKSEVKILMDRIHESSDVELKYLNDFVLLDIGHPIHIYDNNNDYIKSINISNIESKKEFITLKNNQFISKGNELLISVNEKPACIAGIIGITGFSEQTTNVVIEAGYFLPENMSELKSAASKLFNVGIDLEQQTLGYIHNLIEFSDISNIHWSNKTNIEEKKVILTYAEWFKVSSLAISIEKICEQLNNYGFKANILRIDKTDSVVSEFVISCIVPSFRSDISESHDLIEEILRIFGSNVFLENIDIPIINENLKYTDLEEDIRTLLVYEGFTEMYNFPFCHTGTVKIQNSLNIDKSYMRSSLMHSLVENCEETIAHGSSNCLIFEIGKVYNKIGHIYYEETKLGILISGNEQRNWQNNSMIYNFYHLKKILVKLSQILDINFTNEKLIENNNLIDYGINFDNNLCCKIKNNDLSLFFAEIFIKPKTQNIKSNENQKKHYIDISISVPPTITFDKIKSYLSDVEFYVFDYFVKEDVIKYGITLIFNDIESLEKSKDIIKNLQDLY